MSTLRSRQAARQRRAMWLKLVCTVALGVVLLPVLTAVVVLEVWAVGLVLAVGLR